MKNGRFQVVDFYFKISEKNIGESKLKSRLS